MKTKSKELDVDFIGGQGSMTKEEEKQISGFLKNLIRFINLLVKSKSARNMQGYRIWYCRAIFSSIIESALSDESTIGKDLEISTKTTTYPALHSFATKLKNSEQASLTSLWNHWVTPVVRSAAY